MLADGGVSRNDFLMQFQADILNVQVERSTSPEVTAWGAACAAALGSGYFRSIREVPRSRGSEVFTPAMDEGLRIALLERWREAVTRAQNWA
jgi:glycerol kinase